MLISQLITVMKFLQNTEVDGNTEINGSGIHKEEHLNYKSETTITSLELLVHQSHKTHMSKSVLKTLWSKTLITDGELNTAVNKSSEPNNQNQKQIHQIQMLKTKIDGTLTWKMTTENTINKHQT
jgi:hypothetical protein